MKRNTDQFKCTSNGKPNLELYLGVNCIRYVLKKSEYANTIFSIYEQWNIEPGDMGES